MCGSVKLRLRKFDTIKGRRYENKITRNPNLGKITQKLTENRGAFPYDFYSLHMAHRYTLFPPGSQVGPLEPYGKCECGRWEHDITPALPCPNAATVTGNIYIHQQVSLQHFHPFSSINSSISLSTFIEDFKRISCGEMRLCANFNVS